jgi:signal transduction histidine kinase
MTFSLDHNSFDALLPFSVVMDEKGSIVLLGKTIRRLYPSVSPHDSFFDSFSLVQPAIGLRKLEAESLQGETLVFIHSALPSLRLIGHIIKLEGPPARFIVALNPLVKDICQPSRFGLTIDDFAFGDPIFELLLLVQTERLAQERAQVALNDLAWENTISRILHELTLTTYDLRTPSAVYERTVKTVCSKLSWDVGHVFILDETSETVLRPSHIWFSSDEETFREFHAATLARRYAHGEGIIGTAWQRGEVVWIPDVKEEPTFLRAGSLQDVVRLIGVAIPIYIEDKIAAVVEFFTREEKTNTQRFKQFFEILGVHLGNVLSRQQVVAREREHVIQLAANSKMATLGKLAAGIAHEINDPLNTLSTTVQILDRIQPSADHHQDSFSTHLERMHRGLVQIRRIVSSLKSFSRDSSRDACSAVPLATLVEHTLDLCLARFASKGVRLDIAPIPEELTLECRSSQISQVLLNLLTNAFDAAVETPEKWVKLEAKEHDHMVEVTVTDSGRGIDSHVAEQIMSPFFTTKPPGKGTGLGLSIASSIVAEHNGELFIDHSAPNTRFVMRIPKRYTEAAKAV